MPILGSRLSWLCLCSIFRNETDWLCNICCFPEIDSFWLMLLSCIRLVFTTFCTFFTVLCDWACGRSAWELSILTLSMLSFPHVDFLSFCVIEGALLIDPLVTTSSQLCERPWGMGKGMRGGDFLKSFAESTVPGGRVLVGKEVIRSGFFTTSFSSLGTKSCAVFKCTWLSCVEKTNYFDFKIPFSYLFFDFNGATSHGYPCKFRFIWCWKVGTYWISWLARNLRHSGVRSFNP